ncbi:unnamed protein product, partial [Amoebophrya sp. A25]
DYKDSSSSPLLRIFLFPFPRTTIFLLWEDFQESVRTGLSLQLFLPSEELLQATSKILQNWFKLVFLFPPYFFVMVVLTWHLSLPTSVRVNYVRTCSLLCRYLLSPGQHHIFSITNNPIWQFP